MEEQKFQERRKVKDNNQQTENSLACARVVCMPIGHTHTGINNITGVISDQARAHVREGDAARPESAPYRGGCAALARRLFHDEMVAAWRERIFADGGQRGRRRTRPSSDRSRLRYGAIVVIPGGAATTPLRVAARDPLG